MTQIQRKPGHEDQQNTMDQILAELARRKTEFREQRYVSADFVAQLKKLGIYRAATPARFGGEPMPPATFLRLIEHISTIDGSAGWVASFGGQSIYLAPLPPDTQAQLYANGPDLVFAGALFPVHPAPPTDTGFRVTGRWKFASGCTAADILCVGIPGDDTTAGKPRGALLRPDQIQIVRDWDVVGMRATGSFDLIADNVEVDRAWTFIRGGEPAIDEPLFRYPAISYAAQALSVVSAGVARAALDYAEDVGAGRASITGAPTLADRAYYRHAIAETEADLRSARAYFYDAADDAWATIHTGDPVTDRQNAHLRLSAAHLARTSASVVDKLTSISGTAVIFTGHPLLDLAADASVSQTHAFLSLAMYDAAGAVFLGQPPTTPGFR